MIQTALKVIFGSKFERDIKKIAPLVDLINSLEPEYKKLSDYDLSQKTVQFKERIARGETLEMILPEAFAAVRETSLRKMKMRHFDVQLMGGIALHNGNIAEMKTGEGKTLTSTLAIYLNALEGKGVHVVTVNEYLARRDAEWMSPIYNALGMSVGSIYSQMPYEEKRAAYLADITYGTNNEYGFDYLRDNMVEHRSLKVQRGHNFAIVDEVDSVLIDEARTPLIISGPSEQDVSLYIKVNRVIPQLQNKIDFEIDEKARTVLMTEVGVSKAEKLLAVSNLYDPANIDLVHHIHQALKAHNLFARDVDYVVQSGEVVIVDEFTGRLMAGRRYSDGLHQAIEAKEKVEVKQENQTLASITFQNYFRMYKKLGGMTGTADTEAVEFKKIYNLDVIVIPANKKMIRLDRADKIYRTQKEKFEAIASDVKERYTKGQPVLVGTVSIENSEKIAKMLALKGVPHSVLNAKYHDKEAEIIKDAGQKAHVTIATNMAGRGTDIVLGDEVKELGGLYIIGSERHESRRIDNQLRGRSGRQGDPGESRFYLSLEDDLMRIFGSDRIAPIMQRLGMEEGEAIEHKMVTNAIERAQKRVEGHNFEVRKHLLEYDDVMNKQRKYIYSIRDEILEKDDIHEIIIEFIEDHVSEKINEYLPEKKTSEWNIEELKKWLEHSFTITSFLNGKDLSNESVDSMHRIILKLIEEKLKERKEKIGENNFKILEKIISLQVIDQKWKDHLNTNDQIREGVWAMGYAQKDPLVEYRFQSFDMFEGMVSLVKEDIIMYIFRAQVQGMIEEHMPEPKEIIGNAIHQDVKSYGVSVGNFQPASFNPNALQGAKGNSQNRETSKAAVHTSGGGSHRKSSRRKK